MFKFSYCHNPLGIQSRFSLGLVTVQSGSNQGIKDIKLKSYLYFLKSISNFIVLLEGKRVFILAVFSFIGSLKMEKIQKTKILSTTYINVEEEQKQNNQPKKICMCPVIITEFECVP